ncbi:MAG: CRTAC1 family protein [Acidobacteriota bacterium]
MTQPRKNEVRVRALALACLVGIIAAPALGATTVTPHFTDIAAAAGLGFTHTFGDKQLRNILMTTGSGAGLIDYDNDGWLDAALINGARLDKHGDLLPGGKARHALFHNRRDGTFEDVTRAAGLDRPSYGQGITAGDFDGDGFVDLYITNYGENQLYRNNGDGTFSDVTQRSGTGGGFHWSTGALFFDFDGDGDLDLYVANYLLFRPDMKGVHPSEISRRAGLRFYAGPRDYQGDSDVLYRNNGDGTFLDVTRQAGLAPGGKGLMPAAADFDGDGDPDLFVANDSTPNFFYRNDAGHFTDIGLKSGVAFDPEGVETGAMGVDIADVDGDGRQDLYVTNFIFEFNNLYRNLGRLYFEDTTRAVHLDKDNYRHVGWATHFADFNHDGRLDCFVANGHVTDYVEGFSQSITYGQRNMLFLGNDQGGFDDVTGRYGQCSLRKRVSRGAAFGDYDHDGDIDILISNSGGKAELLRNDLPPNDRWLEVRLEGNPPNTRGIGAKVTVEFGQKKWLSEVRFAGTYLSASEPIVHVGLGEKPPTGTVTVHWPSGITTSKKARAGTVVVIREAPHAEGKGEPAVEAAPGKRARAVPGTVRLRPAE